MTLNETSLARVTSLNCLTGLDDTAMRQGKQFGLKEALLCRND